MFSQTKTPSQNRGFQIAIGLVSALLIVASMGFIIWFTKQRTSKGLPAEDPGRDADSALSNDPLSDDQPITTKAVDKEIAVYLVWWDQSSGFETIQTNRELITEVNPFWYTIDTSGQLIPFTNAEDSAIVQFCQNNNISVLPVISNEHDPALVQAIIHNSSTRDQHIQNIVDVVVKNDYDGIEIDYESLEATDKTNFSVFISDLAVALKENGKQLSVAVHAKTSDQGTWGGPSAQDWQIIGETADSVKIMTYDYHWSTSEAGEIAPLSWMTQVYNYAITRVPKDKIRVGVHLYGYDWIGSQAQGLTYIEVLGLITLYDPAIMVSASQEKYFTYSINGNDHTVYYSDSAVVKPRLEYANNYDLGGTAFWCVGGEDPEIWQTVRSE